VINTNLPRILHRFQDIAFDRSKIAKLAILYTGYIPLVFNSLDGGVPLGRSPYIFFRGCQRMAKVPNAVEKLPKISPTWAQCTSVTDRQTDDRRTSDSI